MWLLFSKNLFQWLCTQQPSYWVHSLPLGYSKCLCWFLAKIIKRLYKTSKEKQA